MEKLEKLIANGLSSQEIERTEMYTCFCGELTRLGLDAEACNAFSKLFLKFQNDWYNAEERSKLLKENKDLLISVQFASVVLK